MGDLQDQSMRFLLVGATNTAVTGLLLLLLAGPIGLELAYTIVFVLGLAFTTVLTGRYVFSTTTSWRRSTLFVLWYLGVYGLGLGLISALDTRLSNAWTVLVILLVTVPTNFLGGRLIFHGSAHPARTFHQERTS